MSICPVCEQIRRQLGDVGEDEISANVLTQSKNQAEREVNAKARSDASAILIQDAVVKLGAYYAWSTYIKSGRYELGEIREEGYDIMMQNYKTLAEGAMRLVCEQHITLATGWFPKDDDANWDEEE